MTTEERENPKRGRRLEGEEEEITGLGDAKRRRIDDGEEERVREDRLTPLPDELLLLVDEHLDWEGRRALASTSRRFYRFFDGDRPGVFSKTYWRAATGTDRVGAKRLARLWTTGWDPYRSVNLMDRERLRILADLRDADVDCWLEDRALLADLFPCYGPEHSFATEFKTQKWEKCRLKANAVVKALEFAGRRDVLERWARRMPYLGSSEFLNLTISSGLAHDHGPKPEKAKARTDRVPERALTSEDEIREFLRTATPDCLQRALKRGMLRPEQQPYQGAVDPGVGIVARILAFRPSLLVASLPGVDWDVVARLCRDRESRMLYCGLVRVFENRLAKPSRRAGCAALYSALIKEWPGFGSQALSWVLEDGELPLMEGLRDSGLLDRILLDGGDAVAPHVSVTWRVRVRILLGFLWTLTGETRRKLLGRFVDETLRQLLPLAVADDGHAETTEALLGEIDARLSDARIPDELSRWMPATTKELDAMRRATDDAVARVRNGSRRSYFLRELAAVCMRGITEETLGVPREVSDLSAPELSRALSRLRDCLLCARTGAEVDLVYRRAYPALGPYPEPWSVYDLACFVRDRRLPLTPGVLAALYRLAKERAWPMAHDLARADAFLDCFEPGPLEKRLLEAGFVESVVDRVRALKQRHGEASRSFARQCYYHCAKLFLNEGAPESVLVGLVEAKLGADLNPDDLLADASNVDPRRVDRMLEILETRMVDVEDGAEGTPMRDWSFADLERFVRAGIRRDVACCLERARSVRPRDVDAILLGCYLTKGVPAGPDVCWWALTHGNPSGRPSIDASILAKSLPSATRFVEALRNHPTPMWFVRHLDAALSQGGDDFSENFTNRYRRRAFLRLAAASTGPEELPVEFWTSRFGSYYVEHGWDIRTLEILRRNRSDLDFSALHAHAEGSRGKHLREWLEANRIPPATRS